MKSCAGKPSIAWRGFRVISLHSVGRLWMLAFRLAISSVNRASARFSTAARTHRSSPRFSMAAERSSLRFSAATIYHQNSVTPPVPRPANPSSTLLIVHISGVSGLSLVSSLRRRPRSSAR